MEPTYAAEIALLKKQVRTMRAAMIIGGVIFGGLAIGGWVQTQKPPKEIRAESFVAVTPEGRPVATMGYDSKVKVARITVDGPTDKSPGSSMFATEDMTSFMVHGSPRQNKDDKFIYSDLTMSKVEGKWIGNIFIRNADSVPVVIIAADVKTNDGHVYTANGRGDATDHLGK